jgi:serine/threonine-protein kinase
MAKDPARRPTAGELVTRLSSVRDVTAGVPALAAPQPTSAFDDSDAENEDEDEFAPRPVHPSVLAAPQPRRRPRNRVAAWRWVRPGAVVLLILAALILAGAPAFDSWRARDGSHSPAATTSRPAGPVGAGGTAAPATPTARGSSAAPGAGATPPPAAAAVSVSSPASRAETSVRPYGPWQCASYHADAGHPVLARPCYAIGDAIRILGHMDAMPGVQADVSMSVQEATSGTTVSGPYTCRALMFTDTAPSQDCGPFDLGNVPHGHRYVVVQSWQYTGRSFLPNGSTKGPEFSW